MRGFRGLGCLVALGAVLAGCANDDYAVIPGGPGSQARMADDLRACKHEALDRHFQAEAPPALGAFGAVGGALKADIEAGNPDADPQSINPNIERCMKGRGYTGTSEN